MRRLAAALLISAVAAMVACAPLARPNPQPAGRSAVAQDQGVAVSARVASTSFQPDARPEVQVEVVNSGTAPVRYIKYDGCDKGFQVWMEQGGERVGYFVQKPDGPVAACTDAVEFADLPPGGSAAVTFVYQAVPGQPPLAAGEHLIRVAFNRALSVDDVKPVVVLITVSVQPGRP